MKKRLLALLLAALTALSLTACGAEEQPVTSQIFAMDTVMDFAVYGEHPRPVRRSTPLSSAFRARARAAKSAR